MEYSKNSIYIVGCAKLPQKTQLLSPANTSFCRSSLTGIQAKFMMQISILSVILQRGLSKAFWSAEAFIPITMQLSKILFPVSWALSKGPYFLYPKYHSYSSGAEHASAALWLIFYFSLDILLSIFYTDAELSYLYIVQNYLLAR